MQSQPVKRVVAGALAATAVIALTSLPQASAVPAPILTNPPTNSADALAQYRQLAEEAEKLNEEKLRAQEAFDAKQAELDKANADLAAADEAVRRALAEKEQYQAEVDLFTDQSFISGAKFAKLSTLLSGSTQDFLDRSSALEVLATDKNRVLQTYIDASKAATIAQQQAAEAKARAQTASDEAGRVLNDLNARSEALRKQILELDAIRNRLSAADRAKQRDTGGEAPNVPAPTAAAQTALNAALSKLGSSYVYGATGPSTFDCSGLMLWAYKQAGITLPRTAASQQGAGVAVSRSQLQPGDLVFYGSPAHHVGMYVGNNKMVHAPTTGDVVKISPLQNNYSGARRVAF